MKILSIVIPIFISYMYIKTVCLKIKTKEENILFIFFAYSVASIIVAFPISDSIHFLIGIMPTMIAIAYVIWTKKLHFF